jgi:hypothetical protein
MMNWQRLRLVGLLPVPVFVTMQMDEDTFLVSFPRRKEAKVIEVQQCRQKVAELVRHCWQLIPAVLSDQIWVTGAVVAIMCVCFFSKLIMKPKMRI